MKKFEGSKEDNKMDRAGQKKMDGKSKGGKAKDGKSKDGAKAFKKGGRVC